MQRQRRKRTHLSLFIVPFLLSLAAGQGWAQANPAVITVDHGPNAANQSTKPYVILISLDGFRYDYARRYHATHLLQLASRGATVPGGMVPAYPSLTFPGHYTIATGLYPENHGIVGNVFYDPMRKKVYNYRDASSVTDGSWYGGTPLWVLAEQQGMRSACFFWPGSEADIQGVRPSYYAKFDEKLPNRRRVAQVLAWLQLPSSRRPHFVTLYFGDTDHAGHDYGPDSIQTANAVHEVDEEIGSLLAGVKRLKLRVDLIIVSDHGMATVQGNWVNLDQLGLDLSLLDKYEGKLLYAKSKADAQRIFESLDGKSDKFKVYRRDEVPAPLHFNLTAREGDPVVVETGPYEIRATSNTARPAPNAGSHGFDPAVVPEMNATFTAAGPDIRQNVEIPPFENVNIYPLIAKILGLDLAKLKTGPVDGKLSVLQSILKSPR